VFLLVLRAAADRCNASGDITEGGESLILETHSEDKGVVGDDLVVIVQDYVLV
jgi:hypothetical protein